MIVNTSIKYSRSHRACHPFPQLLSQYPKGVCRLLPCPGRSSQDITLPQKPQNSALSTSNPQPPKGEDDGDAKKSAVFVAPSRPPRPGSLPGCLNPESLKKLFGKYFTVCFFVNVKSVVRRCFGDPPPRLDAMKRLVPDLDGLRG